MANFLITIEETRDGAEFYHTQLLRDTDRDGVDKYVETFYDTEEPGDDGKYTSNCGGFTWCLHGVKEVPDAHYAILRLYL